MSKRLKMWAFAAALVGGSLMGGCGLWGGWGSWLTTTGFAILQEELAG